MPNYFNLIKQINAGQEEASEALFEMDKALAVSLMKTPETQLKEFAQAMSTSCSFCHVSTGRTFDMTKGSYTIKDGQSIVIPVMGEEFECLEIPLCDLPQWSFSKVGLSLRNYVYEFKGKQYAIPLHSFQSDMPTRFELEPWSGGHNRLLIVEPKEEFISLGQLREEPRMPFRLICMYSGKALNVRTEVPGFLSQKEVEALLLQHKILEHGEVPPCV
ncbi:hypothetical protein [Vibrio phage vB_VmeM-Yong XC32]|nr:hypothetical protein [Vibrio phage vB_VmeM-Yong XC31]QAX96582.1 hypothetical protein [Vibrio phage vB_VmeM-Yong XC32]QAX96900.1 hypothetical protein [Vibrio phage vB_VmeM-Yong MS31]QAX97205.1 hypothetical protein [Vibrio phage vB_VmeM-Yong MS32]